ncbi:MAG: MerR family transcriptional regulator [Bdellovibrionaceae bacterium]|nr:MerR family transcriptional regulator [Bdellovibrio sp.]
METLQKQYFTADLIKSLGIGRNTLRLYEEIGLLSGRQRTLAGYRTYTEEHFANLKFIIAAKKVGFTLNEIKSLLSVLKTQKNDLRSNGQRNYRQS